MSDKSSIEWTDATWNPIRGTKGRHHCVRVSEGCRNCYAATMNHRFGGPDYVVGADVPRLDEEALLQPLKWKKPRRIFVCSMTDLFADFHSDDTIDEVFAVMALAPHHTFQVLTKRASRMRKYLVKHLDEDGRPAQQRVGLAALGQCLESAWEAKERGGESSLGAGCRMVKGPSGEGYLKAWPLPNVWLGVSAENQTRADERIPDLLKTPAAVRFVSAEPLLGPIDLRAITYRGDVNYFLDPLRGRYDTRAHGYGTAFHAGMASLGPLHWVIVGGESGPDARPCDVSWVRYIRNQCAGADVACFVKQLGAKPVQTDGPRLPGYPDGSRVPMSLSDRKGGDPSEWPADLRVRQMPEVAR